jgi:hypothetical protein
MLSPSARVAYDEYNDVEAHIRCEDIPELFLGGAEPALQLIFGGQHRWVTRHSKMPL